MIRWSKKEIAAHHAPKPADDDDDEKEEEQEEEEENVVEGRMERPPTSVTHAFDADGDDHCETSPEAHANVVNFLNDVASRLGKKPSELIIYDPYYCAGGTERSFNALGFRNVINRNEDFYAVARRNEVPEHGATDHTIVYYLSLSRSLFARPPALPSRRRSGCFIGTTRRRPTRRPHRATDPSQTSS